ncbi:LysM peptidoglycan-binding domain-containing protein [Pyxidicoccus sp. 3LG]
MSLAKLKIEYEKNKKGDFLGKHEALFNPNQLAYENKVSWRLEQSAMDSKVAEYRRLNLQRVEPSTFSIELFFDTYEGEPRAGLGLASRLALLRSPLAHAPLAKPSAVSVVTYTRPVAELTHYNKELHRPPVCKLSWGRFFLFKGVLSQVSQRFTFFMEDGTPVRATLGCVFTEYQTADDARRGELHSADVAKKYTVRPGDTLINIAAELYGDLSLWRVIADANRLQNPRRLEPGRVLDIPPLS